MLTSVFLYFVLPGDRARHALHGQCPPPSLFPVSACSQTRLGVPSGMHCRRVCRLQRSIRSSWNNGSLRLRGRGQQVRVDCRRRKSGSENLHIRVGQRFSGFTTEFEEFSNGGFWKAMKVLSKCPVVKAVGLIQLDLGRSDTKVNQLQMALFIRPVKDLDSTVSSSFSRITGRPWPN